MLECHSPEIANEYCSWSVAVSFEDEIWSSGCGEFFCFFDGGPGENGFNYCQYCGKKIMIKLDINAD